MLNKKQFEMLQYSLTPKFMATRDREQNVNVVMISSIDYYQEMIVFSNLFMWKTFYNLQADPYVSILVIDANLNYFNIEGIFRGFEETGELVDYLNRSEFTRYNAYTGIRSAGKIEIINISPVKKMSFAWLLSKHLSSRVLFRSSEPHFPRSVAEKFSRLKSIKVVSFQDNEGNLMILPLPAFNVSGDYLLSPVRLPAGKKYAASVITPEIVSFQIKGTMAPQGLIVEEVYAAGPPVAGKLIYSLT